MAAAISTDCFWDLNEDHTPCARSPTSSPLFRAGPLLGSLLPDATGEGMAEHKLSVRNGCRRRCDLLGALRRDLLVGDGLGELPDPKPTGIAGGAVGWQDVVGSYGFVGIGYCRVFPDEE